MDDPITTLLAQQSRARLIKLRTDAHKQILDLQQQITWLDRAIEQKGGAPSAPVGPERRAGRKRSEQRQAIREILNSRGVGRPWQPSEVQVALTQRGLNPTTEAVRVTLRRMEAAGETKKDSDGWRLVSAEATPMNGAAPADDASSGAAQEPESAPAAENRLM